MNKSEPTGRRESSRLYWPQLDGLRACAFAMVFISHQGLIERVDDSGPWRLPVLVLNRIISWCWSGVDLFYVLSGFLITSILWTERVRFGNVSYRAFFMRRSLRIWPLHYWIILLSCFMVPIWGLWGVEIGTPGWWLMMKRYAGSFTLFLGNFPICTHEAAGLTPLLAILWSVCIEEQFYLSWGAVMSRLRSPLVLLSITLAALPVSLLVRQWLYIGSKSHIIYYYNTFAHLDPFALGCMVSVLMNCLRFWSHLLKRIAWPLVIAGLTVWITLCCVAPSIFENKPFNVPMFTILSVGWALLLTGVLGCKPVAGILSFPFLVHLGRLTYGMYVYHFLGIYFATWLTDKAGGHSNFITWMLRLLAALGFTYACSLLSWFVLEVPFLTIRHRFARVESSLDDRKIGSS